MNLVSHQTGNMFITVKTCIPVVPFNTIKIPITRSLLSNVLIGIREQVKMLPVVQVVLFGFASIGVGKPTSAEAISAAVFPLSSPFAMIARAAEQPALWPHLLALIWQVLWVALILKVAAAIFRRSVLKSGPSRRWPWQRRKQPT